ncbi:MAG: hypothetical protein P4N60_16720, partial [Verrucomicrobiae bacterium]|nr:hypothetical protein [Verrucomicrobiae bacterium]
MISSFTPPFYPARKKPSFRIDSDLFRLLSDPLDAHFTHEFPQRVQVQNIGNTSRGRMKPVGFGMPWKMNEPMDQRIEFAKKALKTDNFRA